MQHFIELVRHKIEGEIMATVTERASLCIGFN